MGRHGNSTVTITWETEKEDTYPDVYSIGNEGGFLTLYMADREAENGEVIHQQFCFNISRILMYHRTLQHSMAEHKAEDARFSDRMDFMTGGLKLIAGFGGPDGSEDGDDPAS